MGPGRRFALVAGVAAIASVAGAQPAGPRITGPIAVYWMSAATQTGFGMPGAGGGGRPDAGAMMRAMMGGGGGAANKSLTLQLGSSQTNPAPAADHLPPQGLGAGPDLPLVTPRPVSTPPVEHGPSDIPREFQKPRGKMLIFWGCGEHARPGQPVVIDFATLSAGNPAAAMAAFKGLDVRPMQPPSAYRNKTYGDWPNERTKTQVPSNGSLVGQHTIKGNYSPQISFTLEEDQDFLGPLNLTTNAKAPGGWVNLGWNLVGNAQAYLATALGGGQDTVVMWTSSETQSAAFAMPDYLSQGDINRLVASRALMGPATRTCAVPKEVLDAMPQGLVQLAAYGGEANFVYPPRPADPKAVWNQQWAVKVRYRSATGALLGMAMPSGGGRGGYEPPPGAAQPQPGQPPRKPRATDILKGLPGLPFPR
ncbi:hypothetical protein [Phenylobacterium sp.]|uniref:hypothetical protein n=1 Tax=Phenylobacterium sp. TaxID=1871053 RepID=UPI0025F3C361|nr:hypothetical protein [Phenylobacterium sp.]